MDSLRLISIVAFVVTWVVGFVWQFQVKHAFKKESPEEYGRIHRDSFQWKIKNDLRFFGYLMFRKYGSLENKVTVRYLDVFRIYVFAFLFVFVLMTATLWDSS